MKSKDVKTKLNSELRHAAFFNRVVSVKEDEKDDFRTVIELKTEPSKIEAGWWENRYMFGVNISGNEVRIRTPKEGKK